MSTTIQVFDPPMCCSSGVCGPTVDPSLSMFVADVEWLKKQGFTVERYNLGQQPDVFVENPLVMDTVSKVGNECFPLIIVDDEIISQGEYPSREQLANLLGITQSQKPTQNTNLQQCIQALQQGKLVFIVMQNSNTKWNEEALEGVNEFVSDPRFSDATKIVQIDPSHPDENELMNELGLDNDVNQATTALLIPPGMLVGVFQGKTSKEMIVSSLQSTLSSCGCGPGGCGS